MYYILILMKSVYVIIVIDNIKIIFRTNFANDFFISCRNHQRAPAEFSVISGQILLRYKRLVDPD